MQHEKVVKFELLNLVILLQEPLVVLVLCPRPCQKTGLLLPSIDSKILRPIDALLLYFNRMFSRFTPLGYFFILVSRPARRIRGFGSVIMIVVMRVRVIMVMVVIVIVIVIVGMIVMTE